MCLSICLSAPPLLVSVLLSTHDVIFCWLSLYLPVIINHWLSLKFPGSPYNSTAVTWLSLELLGCPLNSLAIPVFPWLSLFFPWLSLLSLVIMGKIGLLPIVFHYTTLHCTALHCSELHCTTLQCTALHTTTLNCTVLGCRMYDMSFQTLL